MCDPPQPPTSLPPTDVPLMLQGIFLQQKPYEVSMFTGSVLYGHARSICDSHTVDGEITIKQVVT